MIAHFTSALRRALVGGGFCAVGSGTSPSGQTALGLGATTITYPTQPASDTAGPLICLVEPQIAQPGAVQATLILKGVGGDTGINMGATGCPFLVPALSATTFVIDASAATSARISFVRVQ